MKLAILVPTLQSREVLLNRAFEAISKQIAENKAIFDVVILINSDNGEKRTGTKRNELIEQAVAARAEYIAFFDDDDEPGDNYISEMLKGIEQGVDCCSLMGQIYWSGKPGKPFLHSIEYKEWFEDEKYYYRCPNHLNCIKLDLVKDIKFLDVNFGEDGNWSMAIKDAGVLVTQYLTEGVMYKYYCGEPKHEIV